MFLQLALLADVVQRERTQPLSPAGANRRRAARLLEALRCCTDGTAAVRLLAALDGPATGCCVTG
ncbi:MAG: hypothetical protein MUE92_09235 [Chloroflexi bacterium]|jgi:hypothetical protein|nr:hypothetical protein [Chloroflexota bacterium]